MRPDLNWFGWSTETIAAVYESDAAAIEGNPQYAEAAFNAEVLEHEKDSDVKHAATT